MRSAMILIAAISLVFIDIVIHGAEVLQKPTRHPGDWWEVRIKTENTLRNVERFYRLDGEYRGGNCLLLSAWQGKHLKLFVLSGKVSIEERRVVAALIL